MKNLKAILIGLALQTPMLVWAQGKYQLSGEVEGLGDKKVLLTTYYQGEQVKDSVMAKKGKFKIKGETPGTLVYFVSMGDQFLSVPIGAGEKVKIEGSIDKIDEATVTGSSEMAVWKSWMKSWEAVRSRAGVLYKELEKVGENGDKTAINKGFDDLNQQMIADVTALAQNYPSSEIVPFIINDRFINYPNPPMAVKTFNMLDEKAKNSAYGKQISESITIMERTAIGESPELSLPDSTGKDISLASLKGKVVLVDFWASWCGPCRKENPNVVKAYEKYHDKGFEILGVSLDTKKDAWLKAIEADQLAWLHVSDLKGWKSDPVIYYGVKAIPTNFLLDKDGKIIAKDLRGEQLEKALEEIF